jgi:CRISPR/Cas system CSM-associated protein Csm4 (group 5 of RAMP superfamily)
MNYDKKEYMLDVDRLMSWVSETPSSERNVNTITTLTYPITTDEEDEMVEKEISENKSSLNESMNNIRYDLIRNLLNNLFTVYNTDMGVLAIHDVSELSFSQKIAFNTLVSKKIIIEVNEKDNE